MEVTPAAVGVALVVVTVAIVFASAKKRSSVPSPWSLPLIGDNLAMLASPAKYMVKRYNQFGPVFRANIVGIPDLYVIADPEVARFLLRAEDKEVKFYAPGASFAKLLGNGGMDHMFIQDQHVAFRKHVGLSLGPQGIVAMLPRLDQLIRQHLQDWAAQGTIDLAKSCRKLSIDLGVGVISGIPEASGSDEVKRLCEEFNDGLYDALALDLPGTALRKALVARTRLKGMLWAGIGSKAAEIEAKFKQQSLEDDTVTAGLDAAAGNGAPVADMLEAQLRSAAPFKKIDAQLAVDRALGNVIGAADTSRHMFFATICSVALAPHVRDKLKQEQQQFMASHGDDLSWRTLGAMTYLDAVVKEAQRVLPAANGSFRQLLSPLTVAGHTLPTGSLCFISTHLLHALDPALVGDDGRLQVNANGLPPHMDLENNFATAFQPERWLDDATRPRQYAAFGSGTHMCMGMHVAYVEAKLLLVHLLREYSFELLDQQVFAKFQYLFPGPVPAPGSDRLRVARL